LTECRDHLECAEVRFVEAARFERKFNFRGRFAINPAKTEVNTETKLMRTSSTGAIEGGRVLHTIGRIEAASTWHPAHGSPLQENWRELVLRELIRKAEDIDADAIIRVNYQNDGAIRIDETRVKLKRVVATGIAVKLSCAD
jgi:hypothetical protein